MGVLEPVNVTANTSDLAIPNVEEHAQAYRLWHSGAESSEYFLVENRQSVGYDAYLPNSGLLIWHVDNTRTTNTKEWYPSLTTSDHFAVALEQADGKFDLEKGVDQGDAGDPFPGSKAALAFNATTVPNSNTYSGEASLIAVENIRYASDTILADVFVSLSAGEEEEEEEQEPALPSSIGLAQNYPNPFNPITAIEFTSDRAGRAQVTVFDCLGRTVATIFDGNVDVGHCTTYWDATDTNGNQVSSGVYFYRLTLGTFHQTKKMILVR